LERLFQVLQRRWLLLATILVFLLLADPTPTQRRLVDAVRAARTSVAAGKIDVGLDYLEAASSIYPGSDHIHLAAANLALTMGEPNPARTSLASLSATGHRSRPARCLAARVDLLEMSAPDLDWTDLLAQCPGSSFELKSYASKVARDGSLDVLAKIIEALKHYGQSDPALNAQLAYRQTLADPIVAAPLLRDQAQSGDPLALDLLTRLQDTSPDEGQAYLFARIGEAFARHQQWDFAADAFEAALAVDDTYVEARSYLGLAYEMLGKDGRPELEQATQAAPNAALPHVFLAQHWSRAGELELTLGELEIAARLDPENPAIAAELGNVYARAGKHDLAVQAFRAATNIAPMNAEFWRLFAAYSIMYEVQVDELGIPAARNALVLAPDSIDAAALLGYAHLTAGDPLLAQRLILRAVNAAPYSVLNQFALGMLLIHQGDSIAGLASMRTAVSMKASGPIDAFALQTAEGMLR
jgi:tetratricopeptide (TPR) repeat protein